MSDPAVPTALAAILDALTLVQGQLETVMRGHARAEAVQNELMARFDALEAGQGARADLVPVLEMILARSIEDRELIRAQFGTVATVAGFAYSAARGSSAPLPIGVADDPLLERYALAQPPDTISQDRALLDWRRVVSAASAAELSALLTAQYEPSPTDTPETRVLRYQLAAITRAEIKGRGGVVPTPPRTTVAAKTSPAVHRSRSDELAALWRAGDSTALFAEPELAGSLDLFSRAEQRGASVEDGQLSTDLTDLHRSLGNRVAAGERPSISGDREQSGSAQPTNEQSRRER